LFDIDDVIVFLRDGKMMITKVDAKTFVGKDIIHCYFDKSDKRTIYNMIYRDGKWPFTSKDSMFQELPETKHTI
jgi:protein associated with RNAse G/E